MALGWGGAICDDCCKRKADEINWVGNYVCENCLSDYAWCGECREWIRDEAGTLCRHVFWTENGWQGAGAYSGDWDACRRSFKTMLTRTGMADDLLTELKKKAANMQLLVDMVFGASDILLRLNGKEYGRILWDAIMKTGEHESPVYLGAQWLLSLEPGKTEAALRRTIRWIREWKRRRKSA